jgi:hypothetical protein
VRNDQQEELIEGEESLYVIDPGAGAATFDELLARACDDASPEALVWARHALDAHLAKLGIDLPAKL